jgi:hypothetical protein
MSTQATEGYIFETAPLLAGTGSAVFSPDKAYRYRLQRTWGDSGRHATWIMLNPSTADAMEDDPTIRRCTAFTKAWGLDGLVAVNLFALTRANCASTRTPSGPLATGSSPRHCTRGR